MRHFEFSIAFDLEIVGIRAENLMNDELNEYLLMKGKEKRAANVSDRTPSEQIPESEISI